MAMKPKGPEEETEMEDREAGPKGERKRGGKIEKKKEKHVERKRGGRIEGKKSEMRPDRRARGGAMADKSPFTEASKMSKPAFERKESD